MKEERSRFVFFQDMNLAVLEKMVDYLILPANSGFLGRGDYTDSSDDEFIFARNGDEIIFSNHREKIGIPQSAAVMNLASFAATIANDTANLTQMTISPTNLDPYSMGDNYRMSPDSQ
jgi:hypothetical protein